MSTAKKPLSDFAKAMRKSFSSSKGGRTAAQRYNFTQSNTLRPFGLDERLGNQGAKA